MRPFRMFFGLAIGIILFLFLARVLLFAFIIAAVMSIIYAIFRRLKDFITYDRYGNHYIPEYERTSRGNFERINETEPLFYDENPRQYRENRNIQFVEAI